MLKKYEAFAKSAHRQDLNCHFTQTKREFSVGACADVVSYSVDISNSGIFSVTK